MLVSKRNQQYKLIYDIMDHLMVYLETVIALASMTYIINLDAYEVPPRDEKALNNFYMNTRPFHCTYDRFHHSSKYICILILMTIHEFRLFEVYKLSLLFSSLKLYCLISKNKIVYRVFEVCCKSTKFLVFNERCTPRDRNVIAIVYFMLNLATIINS